MLFRDNDITTDGQKLIVYGDEPQIQQVLVNLIQNAIQATKKDNKAVLTLIWGSDGNLIKIKLIDQGAGISNLDNIFVPFYTTKEEGSGIGLVLSRQIINNHGGDLTIANRTDAQGAEAIIYLPGK